jgi:hypothetical protein
MDYEAEGIEPPRPTRTNKWAAPGSTRTPISGDNTASER